MGATAFQKGLGAIHALSHPIGALYGTHHGTTNAVVMPAVLESIAPRSRRRSVRLAAYLGFAGGFDGFLAFVIQLRAELCVPDNLAGLGVPREGFEQILSMSLEDPTAGGAIPFR